MTCKVRDCAEEPAGTISVHLPEVFEGNYLMPGARDYDLDVCESHLRQVLLGCYDGLVPALRTFDTTV